MVQTRVGARAGVWANEILEREKETQTQTAGLQRKTQTQTESETETETHRAECTRCTYGCMISMRAVAFSFEKPACNVLPGTLPSSQCLAELDPLDGNEAYRPGWSVSSDTGCAAVQQQNELYGSPHSIIITV